MPLFRLLLTSSLEHLSPAPLSKSPKTKKKSVGEKSYIYSLPSPDKMGG